MRGTQHQKILPEIVVVVKNILMWGFIMMASSLMVLILPLLRRLRNRMKMWEVKVLILYLYIMLL